MEIQVLYYMVNTPNRCWCEVVPPRPYSLPVASKNDHHTTGHFIVFYISRLN